MKYKTLVFVLFLSNLIFSQNDSIPSENEIYAREFTSLKPLDLPDYPIFKGLEWNTIGNCLAILDLFNNIKEDIDFTNERKQILYRLSEMSTILANEEMFVYLTNGMDCFYDSKKKNEEFNQTKRFYICIADCIITKGESEAKEAFNKTTLTNENNFKKIK
jgi:hypothetical protein